MNRFLNPNTCKGCPQHIAKRGHYGSFLQDEWNLIKEMVSTLDKELSIPVTCKIRVFDDVEKTIAYAKMLQDAGCSILTVHGRTREQKGHNTGSADWDQIKRVKESLSIPVFANGNILYYEDIQKCLEYTKVDGIMTAEGNLYNPCIFTPILYSSWNIALEYLDICRQVPHSATISMIRGHLFKLFHSILPEHVDLRCQLVLMKDLDEAYNIVLELKERICLVYGSLESYESLEICTNDKGLKILPKWVLQPYIRKSLDKNVQETPLETSMKETKTLDDVQQLRLFKRKRKEQERESKIASRKCI